jgi:methionyl aminopeptidase
MRTHDPKKIIIKTSEEIEWIRAACKLNAAVLDMIWAYIVPGISTEELDHIANNFVLKQGWKSACIDYLGGNKWWKGGYSKYACISVNDVICHGVPNKNTLLKEGDIFNFDASTILNGYIWDASRMYTVWKVTESAKNLIDITKKCLDVWIQTVKPGGRTGDIGFAISQLAESNGYSVVREYTGHGVGILFHEEPIIWHKAQKWTGEKFIPGMIFTIEPMINIGGYKTKLDQSDGWTVRTKDGSLSAQFEHTILVTETGYEILTATDIFR